MNELLFTGQNMGGVCLIRLLDVELAGYMPDPIEGTVTDFTPSEDWEDFPVQDQQSEVSEVTLSNGGKMYSMKLIANIRKQESAKTQLLYGLQKKRFLVDFVDQNGERRLAGTVDEGVAVNIVRNETRRQAKEPNEYQVEMKLVRRFPIPFYVPRLVE